MSLNEIFQVHITYSADFFIWVDCLIFYLFYYSHFGGKIFPFTFKVGWIVCQSLSAENFLFVLLFPSVPLSRVSVIHIPGADLLLLSKKQNFVLPENASEHFLTCFTTNSFSSCVSLLLICEVSFSVCTQTIFCSKLSWLNCTIYFEVYLNASSCLGVWYFSI